MMKKLIYLIPLFALLLIGAKKPIDVIEFTIINKAGRDIAISLKGKDQVCFNQCDTRKGEIYYLTVPAGINDTPSIKSFEIEKNTYGMQLYYIQTWDPVYGLKCPTPSAELAGSEPQPAADRAALRPDAELLWQSHRRAEHVEIPALSGNQADAFPELLLEDPHDLLDLPDCACPSARFQVCQALALSISPFYPILTYNFRYGESHTTLPGFGAIDA